MTEGLQRLLLSWGIVMLLFTALLFYRSTLTSREDDQLFIDESASSSAAAKSQQELIEKVNKLRLPINTVGTISGVMLLAIAGWAMYLKITAGSFAR
jgi:hypothetical protein